MKPSYELYFTRRESIETPFFTKIMKESRFSLLMKFLHFADNNLMQENVPSRKLYKVKPILDHMRRKFMTTYIPEKYISVDESLVGWKGRLQWKQYIPSKRKRFGMKLFMLCESSSGYVYNFIIYTGADTDYGHKYQDEPLSARVVLALSDNLLDKGYCLYLDNFYTSPNLVDKLLRRRTDCVGTMRLTRKGVPEEIKSKKLEKGQTIAMYRRKQMLLKWKDKKDILMVSTVHDDNMIEIDHRNKRIKKPAVVAEYNQLMGGVDLADNCLHFYSLARTHLKKYYKKLFLQMMNFAMFNSYILYKKSGGRKSRLTFNIELAEKIISKYGEPMTHQIRRSKTDNPSRLTERHFPAIIPPTTNKEKPTKRCVLCSQRGVRKESRYWCLDCRTGLCPAPCFGNYHTK